MIGFCVTAPAICLVIYIILLQKQPPEVIYKKGVLENFTKFTGKHLCQSLFFNKVAGPGPRPATLLKKRLWHRCFPVNFVKFPRTPFLTEHLQWLLLLLETKYIPKHFMDHLLISRLILSELINFLINL